MEREIKWIIIVILCIIGALLIGKIAETSTRQVITQQKLDAGLEECPIRPNSGYTLWVKSCKEYSEICKNYKTSTEGR